MPSKTIFKIYCLVTSVSLTACSKDVTGQALKKLREKFKDDIVEDVYKLRRKGLTDSDIVNYFWESAIFQGLWRSFGYDKHYLQKLIE